MSKLLIVLALTCMASMAYSSTHCEIHYSNSWSDGFQAMVYNFPGEKITKGWVLDVMFSHPVESLEVYNAKCARASPWGYMYRIRNEDWNEEVWDQVNVDMVGEYDGPCFPVGGECPRVVSAWFQGVQCKHITRTVTIKQDKTIKASECSS